MKILKCKDCGKEFERGDEGDNEKFCLRCEYVSGSAKSDDDNDFRDYDLIEDQE